MSLKAVHIAFITIATLFSAGFGVWALVQTIGPDVATTGTVMLSVAPFLMGFQLLLAAIILDILSEPK